jgi:polyisoprenoid-binding protein YceI
MQTSSDNTTTVPLKAGVWKLDPAHSAVVFSIRHLGLSKVRGRFDRFDATLVVGPTVDEISVDATVDMASVNTNNDDRDAHVRNTDFFDVDKHPTMRFTSTGLNPDDAGETVKLAGDLTINGTTKPIVLDVEFGGVEDFRGTNHAGFSATGELRRSEFGIDFGAIPMGGDKLMLADKVAFELDLQFVEPADS